MWTNEIEKLKIELEELINTGNADSSASSLLTTLNTAIDFPTVANRTQAALETLKYKIRLSISDKGYNSRLEQLQLLSTVETIQKIGNGTGGGSGGGGGGASKSEIIEAIDSSVDLETVKTRLQTIANKLTSSDTSTTSIDSKIDDIVTAVDTLNLTVENSNDTVSTANTSLSSILASITRVEGFIDTLETLINSTNTKLDSVVLSINEIDSYIDGVETLITTSNTNTLTSNNKLDTLNTKVDISNNNTDLILDEAILIKNSTEIIKTNSENIKTNLLTIKDVVNMLAPTTSVFRYMGNAVAGNVKNSAGKIYSVAVSNISPSTKYYFQLFNSTSVPTTGAVPLETYPIYAEDGVVLDYDYFSKASTEFSNGISWGFSTTAFTYTPGDPNVAIVIIRLF